MPIGPILGRTISTDDENVDQEQSRTLKTPRQFGPMIRMPDSRAISLNRSCMAIPSALISANPDVKATIDLTPLAAHSSATFTASRAATAMTA